MLYYSKEETQAYDSHHFAFLKLKEENNVFYVTLNNPAKKNALSPPLLNELAYAFSYAAYKGSIHMLVLQAEGNVFCAGADLKAFAGAVIESDSTIPKPAKEVTIGEIFTSFHKPSIARVEGDVYAGGFLLLCGVRFVMAQNGIKLGLPEVKRGLFPFQVMAALNEVMPARKVLDWCVRGYNLPVEEAATLGLVTQVIREGKMDEAMNALIAELKENSPTAMRMGIAAYEQIKKSASPEEHALMKGSLMQLLQTPNAMEGLTAFREKRKPNWKDDE
ncbi:MAG: enoyl-CoA hydratase-related protein [Flavobacteriales bacterium]|nr:enoyl-CoA hydratase-related protein [Flavobacteriales bacterium]